MANQHFTANAGTDLSIPANSTAGGGAVVAPGNDILTTGPRGTYDFFSGSSLAAAHVSGVAALLLERRPELRPAELRELLYYLVDSVLDRQEKPPEPEPAMVQLLPVVSK